MTTDIEMEVMDRIDHLNVMVRETDIYKYYCRYSRLLEEDAEVAGLISEFNRMKVDFEEVSRFGKYHPDFSAKRRELNNFKKTLDMHPVVMEYRRAEFQLQEMLDEVLFHISSSISDHVNVVSSNPFFSMSNESGCATGGSCGCQTAG